jgi:hypothetical protein
MYQKIQNKDGESLCDEAETVGTTGHTQMASRVFFLLAKVNYIYKNNVFIFFCTLTRKFLDRMLAKRKFWVYSVNSYGYGTAEN